MGSLSNITVKANVTDIAKVINKKLSVAVAMLGFKHVKSMDYSNILYNSLGTSVKNTNMTYTANGKMSSSYSNITGDSYYQNQAGKWNAYIRDKKITAFGVKVGMAASKADANLKKYGWRLWYDGLKGSGSSSRMYSKNGSIVNITFRNGKVYEIMYRWQMESEY
jgi:hypothetical protein